MATNRAAVLNRPGSIVLEERPVPAPGPREVLVEVTAVGVCGSDVHYYQHGRIGHHVVSAPLILGHESAGRVAAVGSEVTRHAVGDRVTVEPGVPCGRCRECRAGRYNLCADVVFLGTPPVDGAFTDYFAIHEDFAFALPDELSDETGALMEPLSVGIWACRKADVRGGDRVLITGAGPIGLLAMQVARAFGATHVEISDVNEHRLALARRTGATRALRAGVDEPAEADAMIECSGQPAALQTGLAALRPAGTACPADGPRRAAPGRHRRRRRHGAGGDHRGAPRTDPEPRALADRDLPVRQHLPHSDRPRHGGTRRPRGHHHRELQPGGNRAGATCRPRRSQQREGDSPPMRTPTTNEPNRTKSADPRVSCFLCARV
jgi:L-iditol 2-dehydrogenase